MPLKIPSHQLRNEGNSSIQKQLTARGFRVMGKPLCGDSGQAEGTGCPGLAGLGEEPSASRVGSNALPGPLGEGRTVWCKAWEKRVGIHPKDCYFWADAWVGLNWSWMSTRFCPC